MLPRSLNNFMNAFTTLDHTMYPIATTNTKDFRNLMTMYLDATLHPTGETLSKKDGASDQRTQLSLQMRLARISSSRVSFTMR
jgi:hypothetical protein